MLGQAEAGSPELNLALTQLVAGAQMFEPSSSSVRISRKLELKAPQSHMGCRHPRWCLHLCSHPDNVFKDLHLNILRRGIYAGISLTVPGDTEAVISKFCVIVTISIILLYQYISMEKFWPVWVKWFLISWDDFAHFRDISIFELQHLNARSAYSSK